MPESWEVAAATKPGDDRLAAQIAEITAGCKSQHQITHVSKCQDCHYRVLECVKARFSSPTGNSEVGEWFTGREKLQDDIDELVSNAGKAKTGAELRRILHLVEARLNAEKWKWYVEKLAETRGILGGKQSEEVTNMPRAPNDESSQTERADFVKQTSGEWAKTSELSGEDAKVAVRRLTETVGSSTDTKASVYRDIFLAGGNGKAVPEQFQAYADHLSRSGTMQSLANKIETGRRAGGGQAEEMERHKKRLGELRRARTAHEAEKAGRKSSAAQLTPSLRPEWADNLPPCDVCGKAADSARFLPCGICHILVEKGVRHQTTVYCGVACADRGLEEHTNKSHACTARETCIQLDPRNTIESAEFNICLCHDCTETFKIESVYCAPECAKHDFARHRDDTHLLERRRLGLATERSADGSSFAVDVETPPILLTDVVADIEQKYKISATIDR